MLVRTPARLLSALAVAIAAAGAGVLAAEPAQAGTSTGTVSGHVVTTDGSPAVGVPITLTTTVVREYPEDPVDTSHVHVYTATTDSSGDYTVTGAQQGGYTITVAPSSVWTETAFPQDVTVTSGSSTAPAITAVRLATVHGEVVAAEDGSPIGGAALSAVSLTSPSQASSNDGRVLSVADGGFTLHVPPGSIRLQVEGTGRFPVLRTFSVAEAQDEDLGAVDLDPSGEVRTRILGRSGHPILEAEQSAVVDGCRIATGSASTCPGVSIGLGHDGSGPAPGLTVLQLAPGTHTVRYEVSSPSTKVVRHGTRTVVVTRGRTTTAAPVVVRADPVDPGTVEAGTYRRGRTITLRVRGPHFTDDTRPHLRTTFLVDGRAVSPMSVAWHAPKAGATEVLVATLPVSWSTRAALSVRAVVHGTEAYAGVTTAARVLRRSS